MNNGTTGVRIASIPLVISALLTAEAHGEEGGGVPPRQLSVVPQTTSASDPPPSMRIEVTEAEPRAPEESQTLLEQWLEYGAQRERRGRLSSGSNQLVASSIGMGLGVWAYVRSPPRNEVDKGIGLSLIGISGLYMSLGIFQLAKKGSAELRFERWQRVAGPGLTFREFARFEGELRSESENASRTLLMTRWSNFGLALTGGLILGLTPAADLSGDAATTAYIVGGITLGIGLLNFGFSFLGTPQAKDWELYQQGKVPGSARSWGAAPMVGQRLIGAQVVGRF